MEVTNALLSNLVETKSMENVLAPIASQVSQLIMVCESSDGWKPSAAITNSAETVRLILMELISAAKNKANEAKNQTYKSDMLSGCDTLSLAAEEFYTSTMNLQTRSASRDVRRAVVQAAKDVLQGTMKVLLIADGADVRAIIEAASRVRSTLQTLTTATSMAELVTLFRTFMEAMVSVTGMASRRQGELISARQREKVIMGLGCLKKAVPPLNKALQNCVKNPNSSQALVSRDSAVKQIEVGLSDITDAVSNRFPDEDYLGLEEAGFFVSKLDQLLEALTEVGREDIPGNFEMWTQDVIAHSMGVAHLCTDVHRDVIITTCQRILLQKGRMLELLSFVRENPVSSEIREDYDEVCEGLIDEFCDLERHVNMAALHLIVATFWQTTETLDRLVQTAMEQAVSGSEWFSVLNDHIVEFGEHADKVCQVASLAAASSTDARRVRCIRLCIHRLEQLDPEIVPAAVACMRSAGDKLAQRHMWLLKEEWRLEFEELLKVIDDMTDPRIFMDVSEEQLTGELNTCNGLLIVHDLEEVGAVFTAMAGKARRVVQVAKQIVDDHEDPIYRNGLMVYVERLRKVIVGTRDSLKRAMEQPKNQTELETLRRRLQRLPEGVRLVREALNKQAHPDILSPLRLNVRQSRGRLPEKKPPLVPDPGENKENEGGGVSSRSLNPYLSSPPPYWSPERREDEMNSLLGLSDPTSKFRTSKSSGVQCGTTLGQSSKSIQTQQPDISRSLRDLKMTDLDTHGGRKRVTIAEPASQGVGHGESYTSSARQVEDDVKGDHSNDKQKVSQTIIKLSPALKPRVLHSDSNSPRHWQGNKLAPTVTTDTSGNRQSLDSYTPAKSLSPKQHKGLDVKVSELRELDNPIVVVAREMCHLSKTVEHHGKGPDVKMTHPDLLQTAKSLSKCGQTMIKFLQGIASHCLDKRFSQDMSYHIHHVSMATVQLDIISSVSMTSADDRSAEEMLIKAAKSLMSAVTDGMKTAETASVKGLQEPSEGAGEYVSAFILAMQWKNSWEQQRHLEANSQDKDELGLRRVNLHNPPSLAELLLY